MKNEQSEHKNLFELHYFPEIPINPLPKKKEQVEQDGSFQPACFEDEGELFADLSEHSAMNWELSGDSKQSIIELKGRAYAQGFTEGEKAGIDSERKNLKAVLDTLSQVVQQLDDIKNEVYRYSEKEVVSLAMSIATKIVRHEVTINKNVILNVLKKALQKIADYDKIKIRVNPSDLRFLKTQNHQFSHLTDKVENIVFEEDEAILPGGCLIETNSGDIDARIEKQIEAVDEAFKSEFAKTETQRT
jgi:flagellar biosynthesis/type III secretory pathway protein FliH